MKANEKKILKLPYRKETTELLIPAEVDLYICEPNDIEFVLDDKVIIDKALEMQSGSLSFLNFVRNKTDKDESILVIVNDQTRPTPTRVVLNSIAGSLTDRKNVTFIIATGAHRRPTKDELEDIFGDTYEFFSNNIIVHDAKRSELMAYIGTSASGTELYINKLALDADKIVVIGSVEPHYFAGYTGGRKGILPGIASYRTIEQNHKHALSINARSLILEGNPVHEDMIDAIQHLNKPIYAIMTVLDKDQHIYAVTAGDIHDSFYAAKNAADEIFVVDINEKADIVITVAKDPMDIDLYQSQKAIDNGKLALKNGGILILVSSCRDGIGDNAFLDLLSSCSSPLEVIEKIKNEYKLGWHKAGKMAEANLIGEVWAVTELPDDILESIFIKPFPSLQNALSEALKIKGENASIIILPDGCVTIPRVKELR